MRSWMLLCRHGTRFCAGCLCSFLLWGLWTLLGILLCFQLWLAFSRELEIPRPLLGMVETHLSKPGLGIRLGHVVFDTEGNLVVRDFSVISEALGEPVLRGRLLNTRVDPWGILFGDPNAHQVEFSGVDLLLPAPLSPSGTSEPVITDIEAVLIHEKNTLEVVHLAARCRGLFLRASGALSTAQFKSRTQGDGDPASGIQTVLTQLRKLVTWYPKLDAISPVRIDLNLTPSDTRIALAELTATAASVTLDSPVSLHTGPVRVSTRLPLAGEASSMLKLELSVEGLELPNAKLGELNATVRGVLNTEPFSFKPRSLLLNTAWIEREGQRLGPTSIQSDPQELPVVQFRGYTHLADTNIEASGKVRLDERSGSIKLRTLATNGLVDLVSEKLHVDLGKYMCFSTPAQLDLDVRLAAGGKVETAVGWVAADDFTLYKVPLDHIEGDLFWNGRHFASQHAMARTTASIARGSYEMDVPSMDYRFVLAGRLQPLRIQAWFKSWWTNFWDDFEFPEESPEANVDINGCWLDGSKTKVFVGVDAASPRLKGVAFKRARTQIYVLPGVVYASRVHAIRAEGEANGWFTHRIDPVSSKWSSVEFDFTGNVDPNSVAGLFPPEGPALMEPFKFPASPVVHTRGWLRSSFAKEGMGQHIVIDINSTGAFAYRGFPLSDVSCHAVWKDASIDISDLNFKYADGQGSGHLKVDTQKDKDRLWFEGSLRNARFSEAIQTVDAYIATKEGRAVTPKPNLAKISEARIDLSANAEGSFHNPFSFKGNGEAQVSGAELSQVRMFGLLSELLRFTTLRFTTAKAKFNIEGNRLVFPDLKLLGRNSSVEAYGSYSLEKQTLDFNAKVWPFRESQNIMQGAMGIVLSPLSHVLAVKLDGTFANPTWSFLISPFRAHSPEEQSQSTNEGSGRQRNKP